MFILSALLLLGCLSVNHVYGAIYNYDDVRLTGMYVQYRSGFILVDESGEASISFDFGFVLPRSLAPDKEDQMVQVTIFSVEDVFAAAGENAKDDSFSSLITREVSCCVDTYADCFQANSISFPELGDIDRNGETFYFDFERAEREINGNYIIEASGVFYPVKSGLYAVMFSFCDENMDVININGMTKWVNSGGLIPAEWFGYLDFYSNLAGAYIFIAMIWGYLCYRKWRQLLLLQNWISVVLIVSLIEVYLRYFDFHSLNESGNRNYFLYFMALGFIAVKRAISRMLVLVVVSGFGVVRPTLGEEKNRVLNIGTLYFGLSMLDDTLQGFSSPYGNETYTILKSLTKLAFEIPLGLLDIYFLYWTFKALQTTILSLEKRGQSEKYELFKSFRLILKMSVAVSVTATVVSFYVRLTLPLSWREEDYESRYFTWANLYLLTCFWDVLYFVLLVAIMWLWIPSERSLKYAYASMQLKKTDEFHNEFDDDLSEDDEEELRLGHVDEESERLLN